MLKSDGGFAWSNSAMRADLAETDYCVARSMWRRLTMILPRMLVPVAAVCCSPVWGEDAPISVVAISQLTAMSERGDAAAQYQLSKCYESGRGIERDDVQAVYWLTKSAELGNVDAQLGMYIRHQEGKGVIKDMTLAITWLRRAALQESTWAQSCLGTILYRGENVKADQESAVVWFMLAAERGDYLAQIRLATCFANGSGVQKNLINSAKWYYIAQLARDRRAAVRIKFPQSDSPKVPERAVETVEDSVISPIEPSVTGFSEAKTIGGGVANSIELALTQLEKHMTEKDILAAKAMALAWFTR